MAKRNVTIPANAMSAVATFYLLTRCKGVCMPMPTGDTYRIGETVNRSFSAPYPVPLRVVSKSNRATARRQLRMVEKLFKSLGLEWSAPPIPAESNFYLFAQKEQ